MLLFQFTQLYFTACQVLTGTRDTAGKGGQGTLVPRGEGSEPDVPEGSPGTLQPS